MRRALDKLNQSYVAVVICIRCGSNRVDVSGWKDRHTARFRCAGCQHETHIVGFTVGRVFGNKAAACLADALDDAAVPELGLLVDQEGERHAS